MTTLFDGYYLKVEKNSSDEIFIRHKQMKISLRISEDSRLGIKLMFLRSTVAIPTSIHGVSGFLFHKR